MVVEAIPSRVVMHVGFHCSEMSTAHGFLRQNRVTVRRHAAFVLDQKLRPAVNAARAFSESRDAFNRQRFQFRFISLLGDVTVQHGRPLMISHPGFLGHMPGAGGVTDYSAAPELCEDMADGIHQAFGEGVEVLFLLTHRPPRDWLDRAWQRLTNAKLTEKTQAAHAKAFAKAADLTGVIHEVRARVPQASVQAIAIEPLLDAAFGVGGIYIDALRLPSRSFDKLSGTDEADARSMADKMQPYRAQTNADD